MFFRNYFITVLVCLGLLLAPLSLCNTIVDQVTVGTTHLITVNADPSTSTGIVANQGSIAFWNNGGTGQFYLKTGSANTAWTRIYDLSQTLSVANGGLGITSTPSNGQIPIGNGTNYVAATLTAGTGITVINGSGSITITAASVPNNFQASAPPVYASSTTLTVANISCIDSANTTLITKTSSTTEDITTTGLNGIAQSANQTGTATFTASSSSVTGSGTLFTSVFQVGDVITSNGGASRRITVITDNTHLTVESNFTSNETSVSFKRGGRAPNTWYYLYATTNGTTPGLIETTRNLANGDTLVDFPSGYTTYRQFAFAERLNSSSNILQFNIAEGWPYRPLILYTGISFSNFTTSFTAPSTSAGTTNVVNGGSTANLTTWSTVSTSSFVPPVSGIVLLRGGFTVGAGVNLRKTGSSVVSAQWWNTTSAGNNGYDMGREIFLEVDSSQQFDYSTWNSAAGAIIDVGGYIVTGIN